MSTRDGMIEGGGKLGGSAKTPSMPRGVIGAPSADGASDPAPKPVCWHAIDLTRRSDCGMLERALRNGWDVPQESQDYITAQLGRALAHAEVMKQQRGPKAYARWVFRIGRILVLMEHQNVALRWGEPIRAKRGQRMSFTLAPGGCVGRGGGGGKSP
jgi:hypothetical protein